MRGSEELSNGAVQGKRSVQSDSPVRPRPSPHGGGLRLHTDLAEFDAMPCQIDLEVVFGAGGVRSDEVLRRQMRAGG